MTQDNQHKKLERIGDASLIILTLLAQGTYVVTETLLSATVTAFFHRSLYADRREYHARNYIKKLKNRGLIESSNDGRLRLTHSGRWELARRRHYDHPNKHTPHHWDRQWRILIFDVPETDRPIRDILRNAIAGYGMYQLQKSVWVYPYDCREFVMSIKNDLHLDIEALFLLVQSIENQSKLEEEFGLVSCIEK